MQVIQHPLPGLWPVVVDLFSGAGGLSLGFEMAGYHIGLGIEKEELAAQTYSYNLSHPCEPTDITRISDPVGYLHEHGIDQVDVITGGPPCQGFSRVGRGKLRHLRNDRAFVHDPRNKYWMEFARFVRKLRPLYFVMENVPDLAYYREGEGLLIERILKTFRDRLGYTVEWRVLRADEFGVPQTRERLFIIGNRLRHVISWPQPSHADHPVTVWEALSDLPVVSHACREDELPYAARADLTPYQQLMRAGAGDLLFNHQTRFHNQQDLHAFAWLREGGRYVELPERFKRYRDDIFEDKYRKLYRDRPSWTIEAHIGKDTYRHIYPSHDGEVEPPRTISVREAARLQSFPDRFRFLGPFCKQFGQLGNAVPPLLAKAVAEAILPGVLAAMAGADFATVPRHRRISWPRRRRVRQPALPLVG